MINKYKMDMRYCRNKNKPGKKRLRKRRRLSEEYKGRRKEIIRLRNKLNQPLLPLPQYPILTPDDVCVWNGGLRCNAYKKHTNRTVRCSGPAMKGSDKCRVHGGVRSRKAWLRRENKAKEELAYMEMEHTLTSLIK